MKCYLYLYWMIKKLNSQRYSNINNLEDSLIGAKSILDGITSSSLSSSLKSEAIFVLKTLGIESDLKVGDLISACAYLRGRKKLYEFNAQDFDELIGSRIKDTDFSKVPQKRLNLEYDNATVLLPYMQRINAVSNLYASEDLINESQNRMLLSIFQIALDESISQAIRSNSGQEYEWRIQKVIEELGLKYEVRVHEKDDSTQEHDLYFQYKGKKIGIGAKRTLRERYKQYNPQGVDCSIVFTIGEDLDESKTRRITSEFKSFIFVSDEMYVQKKYLADNPRVYKASSFTLETLNLMLKEI